MKITISIKTENKNIEKTTIKNNIIDLKEWCLDSYNFLKEKLKWQQLWKFTFTFEDFFEFKVNIISNEERFYFLCNDHTMDENQISKYWNVDVIENYDKLKKLPLDAAIKLVVQKIGQIDRYSTNLKFVRTWKMPGNLTSNNWNAAIKGFEIDITKNKIFIDVYWQESSTDYEEPVLVDLCNINKSNNELVMKTSRKKLYFELSNIYKLLALKLSEQA